MRGSDPTKFRSVFNNLTACEIHDTQMSEMGLAEFRTDRLISLVIVVLTVIAAPLTCAGSPPVSRNLEKAQTFVEQGEYKKALPFVNASIRELTSSENLYLRGHVLLQLGRVNGARKDANKLIDEFESSWRGYFLKVRVLLRKGPLESQKETLHRLLRKTLLYKPGHKRARLLLGRVYAAKGQTKKALDVFQQVSNRLKSSPGAGRTAARVAFLEGKEELASDWAQQVLVTAPDDLLAARVHSFVENDVERDVERQILQYERRAGEWSRDKRLSKLRSLRNRFPDTAHLYIFCSKNVLELGRTDQSLKFARQAEGLEGDAWTAFWLGTVFEEQKQYADAARWYVNASNRREPFGVAHLRAGVCLSRDGQHKRAIGKLRRVFDQVAINKDASKQLLKSCLEAGYLVYARERLDRLAVSSDDRALFRKKLDDALKDRQKQETDSVEDGVYQNSLYGIELSLPDHWSYSIDAGRPAVVALFLNTASPDRFFIVAERRLPGFTDRSLEDENMKSKVREYLISKFLLKQTDLQFLRQRSRNDLNRRAIEFVFRGLEGEQRMHCFVMFRKQWMLTFNFLARGERKGSRQRMNKMMKQVIIEGR